METEAQSACNLALLLPQHQRKEKDSYFKICAEDSYKMLAIIV